MPLVKIFINTVCFTFSHDKDDGEAEEQLHLTAAGDGKLLALTPLVTLTNSILIIIDHFYMALFSALEQTHCAYVTCESEGVYPFIL